ncbi:MAG: ABC transporter permease [Gemmiger sp.]
MQKLKQSFAGFWRYRYLLQNLISRDFKLKYRRSILGVAWSVLNPLLTCLVMYVVFDSIMRGLRGEGIPNFAAFLLIGQLLFNFFRESTSMAMESVLKNAPLLRKVYIPKYIFPLEKACFAFVNCLFSFVALIIVLLITWTPVSLNTFLLALYPLVMLFFFSLGIGLVLASLYVFVRDIMHIWEVFCTLLSYASAIFYDPEMMDGMMQQIIHLNPLYWFITAFRSCVLWGTGLTTSMVVVCFLCAACSMALGICVFKKTQDKFVLYM